ncbi:MAG: rRNA adenine N-6-methyltransferase family protein [Marinoscillum sp.]
MHTTATLERKHFSIRKIPQSKFLKAIANRGTFMMEFLKDWKNVAAILPTTSRIGQLIASQIDFQERKVIVEIGPGTGAISHNIIEKLGPDSTMVLIERNATFVKVLQAKYSSSRVKIIHGEASQMNDILSSQGIEKVDALVSSIPMTHLSKSDKEAFVASMKSVLKKEAKFFMLLYTKNIIPYLSKHFNVAIKVVRWTFPLHYVFISTTSPS